MLAAFPSHNCQPINTDTICHYKTQHSVKACDIQHVTTGHHDGNHVTAVSRHTSRHDGPASRVMCCGSHQVEIFLRKKTLHYNAFYSDGCHVGLCVAAAVMMAVKTWFVAIVLNLLTCYSVLFMT